VVPGPLVQVRPVLLSADVRSDAGSSERVATAVATEPCWLRGAAESMVHWRGRGVGCRRRTTGACSTR